MDKPAIKKFAIWARNKLKKDAEYCAEQIGITKEKIVPPLPQSTEETLFFDSPTGEPYKLVGKANIKKYRSLVESLKRESANKEYSAVYDSLIERAAYTWFNRMIAVRYMEVNDLLPSHTRVLSATDERKKEPQIVENPSEAILDYTPEEIKQIQDWQYNIGKNGVADMLFRMLFLKQCYALNEVLPKLFDNEDGYLELLLRINFTDADGVVYHLTHDIKEENWRADKTDNAVQIVGWLYQYYNTEPKAKVFADLNEHHIKISAANIPAATQLFTPDWIVRYMVENSLGRLWSEGHPDFDKSEWKYYLDEAPQEPQVAQQLAELRKGYAALTPEDIKCIDPCMGSGHILAYLFDVLMQIYTAAGYSKRDAAASIVEHNLYGLDIDDRAAQMAYFVVMMKGCQYDSRFLRRHLNPHVYAIQESGELPQTAFGYCGPEEPTARTLWDTFRNAKEYGSILQPKVTLEELDKLEARLQEADSMAGYGSLGVQGLTYQLLDVMYPLIDQARMLVQKYDVVVTNPPYMGSSGMNARLSDYVKKYYPDSKSDLFAVFIERCARMDKPGGYQAMITQHAWMFLSSFEKLRAKLQLIDTVNMAHLGARGFDEIGGEVVQTTSFVMRNSHIKGYKGTYCRLIDGGSEKEKAEMFVSGKNRYMAEQDNFSKIPGSPVAYWIGKEMFGAYDKGQKLKDISTARVGLQTSDNNRFLRLWYECGLNNTEFYCTTLDECNSNPKKWYPHNKGGAYRKWYGNIEYIINYGNGGYDLAHAPGAATIPELYAFREAITYSRITSGDISFRIQTQNTIFDSACVDIFPRGLSIHYLLGLLNAKLVKSYISVIAPTLNTQPGDIAKLPIIIAKEKVPDIEINVDENINLSKSDWDSFETSWDFAEHPIVKWLRQLRDATSIGATMAYYYHGERPKVSCPVELCYMLWQGECNERFAKLKANEEELNRIFIDIYGLQDELTPEVEDKDVTVRRADLGRDIRSLISYAVGCIFGRYSLNKPGLAYAGGDWNPDQYHTFLPDADNVIPITDEEYFTDDLTGLFVAWVKKIFGADSLEDNLAFIAKALGVKGTSPRAVIRNYFLNGFYADHVKIYQKRPIYWLYDSGKQNGFKALIYMHRYNADTSGLVRAEYLYKMEQVYESEIARMDDAIAHGASREVAQATKRKEKLVKQLKECKDYDDRLGHIALARIPLDLDDGVKANYDKVQTGVDGKKLAILAKI